MGARSSVIWIFFGCWLLSIDQSFAVLGKLRGCVGRAIGHANDELSRVALDSAWDRALEKLGGRLPADTLESAKGTFSSASSDICTLGSASASCSGTFAKQLVKSSLGAGLRAARYDVSPTSVRQEMLVPMLALTRRLKESKSILSTLVDGAEKDKVTELIAKDMARLFVFGLETSAKAAKTLQPVGAGKTAASAGSKYVIKLIRKRFITVLFAKNLSMKEKMNLLTDHDRLFGPGFIKEFATKFKEGWSKENIEKEIEEYTKKL